MSNLRLQHYGLFRQEPYQEPRLTGHKAFRQTLLVIFWMVIGAGFMSVLPSRHSPHKPMGLAGAAMTTVFVGGYYFYRKIWRPWRDGPPGYRLVGEFEVREKNNLLLEVLGAACSWP